MSGPMGGGKKSAGSNNSSMANTPASTPITSMANGQQASPPPNNAPKYGTLVPNRIFVGGISANTTETELLQLFSNYGTVKAAKIIQDRAGVSKGYGFITFESEEDAKRLQRDQDNIVLRERKLNIAPAIKKQPFSRAYDGSSPPAVAPGYAPNFFPPGSMPFFQGGLAYYPQPPAGPADPATQPPAVYQTPSVYPPQSAPPQAAPYQPMMFPPQPIYVPQQYPMPMPYEFNYYPNGGAPATYGQNGGPQQQGLAAAAVAGQMHHQQQQQQQPPPPPQQQQSQRPNSPPRAHCYPQPLQNATAGFGAQDVYYNVPFYQVEDAMYTDPAAMEAMALAGGVVPEDHPQQDDCNAAPLPLQSASSGEPARQSATPVVSLLSLDHQQEKDLLSMQSGRRRKPPPSTPPAAAPHAALHPHHQHAHAAYMPSPPPSAPQAHVNGYAAYAAAAAAAASLEYHYAPVAAAYGGITPCPPKALANGGCEPRPWHGGGKRAWRSWEPSYHYHHQHHRRSVDACMPLPRADSSSSPGVPAEEARRGDDKRRYSQPALPQRGQCNLANRGYGGPALSPYHHQGADAPLPYQQQRRTFVPSGKAQFRNSNRSQYTDHSHQPPAPFRHTNTLAANGAPPLNPNGYNNNNNNNNAVPSSAASNSNHGSGSGGGGGGKQDGKAACAASPGPASMSRSTPSPGAFVSQMQPMPQHFVAPARHRNRRTMRRGGGVGEIGAGDAPLTSSGDSISDACSKMDSLKL